VVGGLLSQAGEDVMLVGRKEHVEAIRQSGLRIEGVLGVCTVQVKAAEW
jgi:ketopantoate reductase